MARDGSKMEEPEITQNTSNSDGTWISQLGSPGWSDIWAQTEKQAKVKAYERQIDRLVYSLYGLTPKEIKIVEGEN